MITNIILLELVCVCVCVWEREREREREDAEDTVTPIDSCPLLLCHSNMSRDGFVKFGRQIFPKSTSHFRILGVRRAT
jgi:hypothetical protein